MPAFVLVAIVLVIVEPSGPIRVGSLTSFTTDDDPEGVLSEENRLFRVPAHDAYLEPQPVLCAKEKAASIADRFRDPSRSNACISLGVEHAPQIAIGRQVDARLNLVNRVADDEPGGRVLWLDLCTRAQWREAPARVVGYAVQGYNGIDVIDAPVARSRSISRGACFSGAAITRSRFAREAPT
jgi:hypothetical protein